MTAWALVRSKVVEPILRAQGSPVSIARGAALGMWFTLTPTVGIQMFLVTICGIPWKANIPVAIALVWISNPLTIVPLYYAFYWMGTLLMGVPTRSYSELAVVFLDLVRHVDQPDWSLLDGVKVLGMEVVTPMLVGSVVLATLVAIPTYHVALRLAWRRHARRLREQAAALDVQGDDPPPGPGTGGPEPSSKTVSETARK
ncbi:MAG: DUF2062 domain-containing protein [Planctomycetota bacterium]